MFADKDGCRCFDETTARCPVHDASPFSVPRRAYRAGNVYWAKRVKPAAGYDCATYGHWDPGSVGLCIHCGAVTDLSALKTSYRVL